MSEHRTGTPNPVLTISWRYELIDSGRRLRAIEQVRGGGRDQDNVWEFEAAVTGWRDSPARVMQIGPLFVGQTRGPVDRLSAGRVDQCSSGATGGNAWHSWFF